MKKRKITTILFLFSIILISGIVFISCEPRKHTNPLDPEYESNAPVIEIIGVNSSYEQGATVNIGAIIVSHDIYAEIVSVKFYVDDVLKSTDETSPYSSSWDSGSASIGSHSFKAVVEDNFGSTGDNAVSSELISDVEDGFVWVSGGSFEMGSTVESDEQPIHTVIVSSFTIGKYEVTQSEYETIMGTTPSNSSYGIGDNYPVNTVSWYDAVDYCNALSDLKGYDRCYSGSGSSTVCDWTANGYRLPTEAEWEFAARGGNSSAGYTYSGSNTIGDVAWYSSNSGSSSHIVGTKQANELGIYDMSGNLYEWCWDWYDGYSGSAQTNPHGGSGSYRVVRGGLWNFNATYCRSASRNSSTPTGTSLGIGFRVSRTL